MLVIFQVFEFGYVKSYLVPNWKRHQDKIVRKIRVCIRQMKDSDAPKDALGIIFRLQLNLPVTSSPTLKKFAFLN